MSEIQEFLVLRGLPGSGKSTFAEALLTAEKGKWKRINKDMLRTMLDNNDWSPSNENHLNQVVYGMIEYYLSAGFNVVSDNMNLNPLHIQSYVTIVNRLAESGFNIGLRVVDMNTPVEICKERDSKRPKPVGGPEIDFIVNKWMKNGKMPDLSALIESTRISK